MVLSGIGTNRHYAITIANVNPMVGHGTATETFRQTGDSGGMSYAGVMFKVDHTERPS